MTEGSSRGGRLPSGQPESEAMRAAIDQVFEELVPPPGGLTRLRARIRETSSPRARHVKAWVLGPAGLAAAATLSLVMIGPDAARDERPQIAAIDLAARSDVSLVGLGLGGPFAEPVVALDDTFSERVPTRDRAVVFYRVEGLSLE